MIAHRSNFAQSYLNWGGGLPWDVQDRAKDVPLSLAIVKDLCSEGKFGLMLPRGS